MELFVNLFDGEKCVIRLFNNINITNIKTDFFNGITDESLIEHNKITINELEADQIIIAIKNNSSFHVFEFTYLSSELLNKLFIEFKINTLVLCTIITLDFPEEIIEDISEINGTLANKSILLKSDYNKYINNVNILDTGMIREESMTIEFKSILEKCINLKSIIVLAHGLYECIWFEWVIIHLLVNINRQIKIIYVNKSIPYNLNNNSEKESYLEDKKISDLNQIVIKKLKKYNKNIKNNLVDRCAKRIKLDTVKNNIFDNDNNNIINNIIDSQNNKHVIEKLKIVKESENVYNAFTIEDIKEIIDGTYLDKN